MTLSRLVRLMRKEISESLRDRRTIFTLVLMPLLLYPVLGVAFTRMVLSSRVEKERPVYRIGFRTEAEASSVLSYWHLGVETLMRRNQPGGKADEKATVPPHLDPLPELRPIEHPDLEDAVRNGRIDVGVRLTPPGPFHVTLGPLKVDCQLLYREDSAIGREAVRYLELLTGDANGFFLDRGIRSAGGTQRGHPVRVRASPLPSAVTGQTHLLSTLVPLILILMTMTGAVYPAIDLTAGERERGTLEILMAAPIPRMSVLLAKYAAVVVVSMLTALANLASMIVTLEATGLGSALFGSTLGVTVLLQVLALLVLFASFFSAVLLTLTSFARSFKEAQAYLIPLVLVCLFPGVLALLPGIELNSALAVVPLINIVLLARDLFAGTASAGIAFVVVATTLLYAVAALLTAARLFGTEAVLTGEAGTWSDLFTRSPQERSAADPATALLLLAVLFPLFFLLSTGLARLRGLDLPARLGLAAAANLVLFAGLPLASAWMGRLRPASAFRLRPARGSMWIVALVLGLCLWPFASEVVLLLRQAGLSTLKNEHLERARAVLNEWRQHSVLPVLVVLAILPAVLEELVFRGYLFSALEDDGHRPVRAVVGSAVIFALFHLLVTDALAVERLPPSLLMGLVLGWLAHVSGSVLPGMLLHVVHNGLLVLLAFHEPWLVSLGWDVGPNDHLPAWLLASAGAGAVLGLGWLCLLQRKRDQ